MSSSGNRSQGRGGCGRGGCGNNNNKNAAKKNKPVSNSTSSSKSNDEVCAALKNYSFDCDAPGSAEQVEKTLEKAMDHLGMTLGNEI